MTSTARRMETQISERSHTLKQYKRQYCITKKPTIIERLVDSERIRAKVIFSIFLFMVVLVIGGFVAKLCEYNRYDEMVARDKAFRDRIRLALNNTDFFEELDSKYTSWIIENPWTDGSSMFFWLTLMTTIGYGDVYPISTAGRLWTVFFGIISIFTSALVVRILGSSHKEILHRSETFNRYPKTCLIFLFVSSSLIFALVFWSSEHETGVGPMGQEGWSYSQSVYFVIMTFTTVGFGDFVPNGRITVFLILYGIIMLTMLVGEAQIMVKRLEADMRKVISLAEQAGMLDSGYNQAHSILKLNTSRMEICGRQKEDNESIGHMETISEMGIELQTQTGILTERSSKSGNKLEYQTGTLFEQFSDMGVEFSNATTDSRGSIKLNQTPKARSGSRFSFA